MHGSSFNTLDQLMASRWDAATKALKLPTLLEGEALTIWMDLSAEEKDNYETVKETLTSKSTSAVFVILDEFHQRKLLPGEALSVFVHHLKKLLLQVMPDLDTTTRYQLLLHQFVAGLPQAVSQQLRVTGEAKDLAATMERARLLISLDDQGQTVIVREGLSDIEWLQEQIEKLTEQVAALSMSSLYTANTDRGQKCCFTATVWDTFNACVPTAAKAQKVAVVSYATGKVTLPGSVSNGQGAPVRGSRHPQPPQ